jgi:hypothetical protein
LIVAAVCAATSVAVPSSLASAAPPGGCPDSFTLRDANENPDWPQHRDRNGDGLLCVKTSAGGVDIVVDNG